MKRLRFERQKSCHSASILLSRRVLVSSPSYASTWLFIYPQCELVPFVFLSSPRAWYFSHSSYFSSASRAALEVTSASMQDDRRFERTDGPTLLTTKNRNYYGRASAIDREKRVQGKEKKGLRWNTEWRVFILLRNRNDFEVMSITVVRVL